MQISIVSASGDLMGPYFVLTSLRVASPTTPNSPPLGVQRVHKHMWLLAKVDGTRGAGRAETGESRGRGGFVFRGTLYMELKPHAIARDLYQCEFFALSPPHGCRTLWSHTGPLRVRALARLLDIAAVWVCGVTARARGRAAG